MALPAVLMIATLLLTAGVAKTVSPERLAQALPYLLPVQPRQALRIAQLLAAAELAAGTLLLFTPTRRAAALAAMGLGAAFAAGGASAAARRLRLDCGCFGSLLPLELPLGPANVAVGAFIVGGGWFAATHPLGDSSGGLLRALALSLLVGFALLGAVRRTSRWPARS